MSQNNIVPEQKIISKIVELRGEMVMLDLHLAELYQVETRTLKQAVRRNLDLFPEDFMFILSNEEVEFVVSQIVIPSKQHLGGAFPFAFTETGVAMLSSVLRSTRARQMNITIIRSFVALRNMALNYNELKDTLEKLVQTTNGHEEQIQVIYDYLNHLEQAKQQEFDLKNRNRIGFKQAKKNNG